MVYLPLVKESTLQTIKELISVVHVMSIGVTKLKNALCFTFDVLALLLTSSEFSDVCVLC
jgi:hypothetical protein